MSEWRTDRFVWDEATLRRLASDGYDSVEVKLRRPDGGEDVYRREVAVRGLRPLEYGQGLDALLARGLDLRGDEARHLYWARIASDAAMLSLCQTARCGAALVGRSEFVSDPLFAGSLLAVGFNLPPGGIEHRRCGLTRPSLRHPKADRTCCVHAEVKAILNADRGRLKDATLYFARVDEGGSLLPSGEPYCTQCSKLALEVGVARWVLWHEDGPREYGAGEYNRLSHEYDERMEALEGAEAGKPGSPEAAGEEQERG